MDKKGLLLINIGSPRSYQVEDVKKYLRIFLMDKEVINLPFILRWPLVNLLIVPRRGPFSAQNYQKVWMDGGSPLIVHSENFKNKLQLALGDSYVVRTGMSFSDPNIEESLLALVRDGVSEILAVPMFPQFAQVTTGAINEVVRKLVRKHRLQVPVRLLPEFYRDDAFIKNTARVTQEFLQDKKVDHFLFSYHGLPEAQIRKNSFCEINGACCSQESSCLKGCYRAQCFKTSQLLAARMGLPPHQWSLAFQSRLGRAKWIGPATDETIKSLPTRGFKKIAVICPSFVADCIETLEEIGIGGKEDFIHAGGEELHLIPCLNSDLVWAQDFARLTEQSFDSSPRA